jgi:Uma2 family endonuclease
MPATNFLAVPAEPAYVPDMPSSTLMTAEELLRTHYADKRVELVRGIPVVREPAGYQHGAITARLSKVLMDHVDSRTLGSVLAAETGFKLLTDPDTVRAADIAFIRRARLPDPRTPGYPALAPDLVALVLSPGDRPGETLAKVADWLNAGTTLVWVIDPDRSVARVYRADGSETLVTRDETLDGEQVVPGFTCALGLIL